MSVDNNKIKVYVVGEDVDYASFLNHTIVKTVKAADLVLFTGGEDVDPALYKQNTGKYTYPSRFRDSDEIEIAQEAIKLNKPIWGTCRGIQLGCVMSGGLLVQHMNHPYMHNITMYDGSTVQANSMHHQLQHPRNLLPNEYHIVGYAKGLSNVYLNGENRDIILPTSIKDDDNRSIEPEIVFYRKTNWFGAQHHPEMMNYNHPTNVMLRRMVDLQLNNQLDTVLSLGIPISRYLNINLDLSEDEIALYEGIVNNRKKAEKAVEGVIN